MLCPKCGNELRISKKDPSYGLCDECRKKFKLPEAAPEMKVKTKAKARPKHVEEEEEHYPRYANIPPKKVREKREREMRHAYDELLAIGEEERTKKKKRFLFF